MFYLIMGAKLVFVAMKVNYAQRNKKKKKKIATKEMFIFIG